jgi:hypothetical protein
MHVEQTYPLHVAAKAARFKPRDFRHKVENGFLELKGCDRASTGTGDPAGYSRRRILQAATMKQITPLDVSASTASAAALTFSDEGQTNRAAGQLFDHGRTLLVIDAGGPIIKNVFHDTSWTEISKHGPCAIIVDLNQVVASVDAELNKHSQKVF